MCDGKCECQKPEELIDKPEKCSPEQIKKCHGDVEAHPCLAPKRHPLAKSRN